jgi:hypothetical protein
VEVGIGPAERHDTYRLGNVSGHVGNPSDQSSGYHQGESRGAKHDRGFLLFTVY